MEWDWATCFINNGRGFKPLTLATIQNILKKLAIFAVLFGAACCAEMTHFIGCKNHCLFNNPWINAAGQLSFIWFLFSWDSVSSLKCVWWSLTPVLTSTFGLHSMCVCTCVHLCVYYRAVWLFWQSVSLWIIFRLVLLGCFFRKTGLKFSRTHAHNTLVLVWSITNTCDCFSAH